MTDKRRFLQWITRYKRIWINLSYLQSYENLWSDL